MATTSNESDSPQKNTGKEENYGEDDSMFECNICLENVTDAVVSFCGHLYCWPCLHRWLEIQRSHKVCPVCKSGINKDKVIPIYGRGDCKRKDPRNNVPPRPAAGQNSEPDATGSFDFNFSFGTGAFPFGFLTSFNFTDPPLEIPVGSQLQQDDQYFSKLFLWIVLIFLIWLLLA